ncbi:MAG TPA: L-seryl-tRNA(Sec) selenium transferase [Anaerolineales bacterium]|nr:L-seryl-tRNA(Sec) selenium transferase [Anaerolineales bacterium]
MNFRGLPSVEHLLQTDSAHDLIDSFGRRLTLRALRGEIEAARDRIRRGASAPTPEQLLKRAGTSLGLWLEPTLRPVINATGVILHTNLGRAPLSESACEAMLSVAQGYSTLEYDLRKGARSQREKHVEQQLTQLTGAEAALVVNNNAAAVLLALTTLARRKEVLISRSQLVEIGGGFRVPEVLKQSGAKLVEVGTTNRTHLHDFETALHERTALILRAHHSNFKIVGFATEPSLRELVELAERHGVAVADDLGSGALLDTAAFGLGHEPMVQESVQAGAGVVAFSGDKLLGGPQAGILVGRESLIGPMRRHPLARAVRGDKLCLAALGATLDHYLRDQAQVEVPVWRMIGASEDSLQARAQAWRARLGFGEIVPGRSTVGGGSLPEETLPTWLLSLEVARPNALAASLRRSEAPVIARVEDDRVVFDPRTVSEKEEEAMIEAVKRVIRDR